jgi:hypothetical protein
VVFHDSSLFPGDLLFPASRDAPPDIFFDADFDWVTKVAVARFVPHPMQSTFDGGLVTPHEGQTTFPDGGFFSSAALAPSSHTSAVPHLAQNLSLRATGDPQLLHEIDGLTATIVPSH